MATLITSRPVIITEDFDEKVCRSTYQEYEASREALPFDKNRCDRYLKGKVDFKKLVIEPLAHPPGSDPKKPAKITIGDHYTIKISELKAMFEAAPEADYIHIHNSLDEKKSHVIYLIPVNSKLPYKSGDDFNKEILRPTSLLIADFPCPPDPRCPRYEMD